MQSQAGVSRTVALLWKFRTHGNVFTDPWLRAGLNLFLGLWSVFRSSHLKKGSPFWRGTGLHVANTLCLGLHLPALSLELPVERIQAFPDKKKMVQEKTNVMGSAEWSLLCGQLKIFIVFFFQRETNLILQWINEDLVIWANELWIVQLSLSNCTIRNYIVCISLKVQFVPKPRIL